MRRFYRRSQDLPLLGRLSPLGTLLGAAAFAAALWPSLIPRSGAVQGMLAGFALGIGYAAGGALTLLWVWVVQPAPAPPRALARHSRIAAVLALGVVIWALWMAAGWQDDIRAAMQMPPSETARPFTIAAIALVLGAVLLFLGRLFRRTFRIVAAQVEPFLPRRLARLVGLVATAWLFWAIGAGVFLDRVLGTLDTIYAKVDDVGPMDLPPPADPLKTGGPGSVVHWNSLGAEGRHRIASGPDAAGISAVSGRPAQEPLRVYVGLNSAATPEARAALALEELRRIGGFSRKYLVIAFPTGTGWVDPAGMSPVEYLTDGDIASVSVQYSYLPSWLSLLVEPEYGGETAHEVFRAIYGHWASLPVEDRPRLYLFGLSLGAMNGDLAADFYDVIAAPYQGALWAGPPFATPSWQAITQGRVAGSPLWAPRFRDGSLIRFTGQTDRTAEAEAPWGPMRIVYLQYASDPIVFFRADSFWRRPYWLEEPRGPDVSSSFVWVPGVTMLQLVFDMMTATTTPRGFGHVYAARDYLAGWRAVVGETGGWDKAAVARLGDALAAEGL
ncbi:MAG: alpha/beta-hydrolase family protein [Gemmobacter sp.]|jgi:uncharacterized membrane protein|nr:alpha/beta-hydrolase family protein [Gemmobacter sp.]